ncbi:hypothetical protein [Pseudoalteromonas sp. T1lg23B]|uniref:hypothetical protein n=1 Tax=Pseudoalteromonas sp. T1lg23B TaxID=2077097 RepID=UPI000CF6E352|nr:hypothetical protein [Pseudoalteromonas sp. T1lg23B]
MKIMRKITIFSFLCLFIFGCTTTADGPLYKEINAPSLSHEQSLIYVIRTDSASDLLGDRDISIDGSKPKKLGDHGFLTFVKPAGEHTIEFGIPWDQRNIWEKYEPIKTVIKTEAGNKYFLQFYTDIQDYGVVVESGVGYRNMSHKTQVNFLEVIEAEKVLVNHRLQN